MADGGEPGSGLFAGKRVTSKRRLGPVRRATYRALAPLLALVVRLAWRTARVRAIVGEEHLAAALAGGGPVLPCFWHQRLVSCLGFVHALRERGLRPCLLISPSVDGELAALVAARFGAAVVRGSATRTGVRALRDLHRAMRRDGVSPVLPADGPQGPARVFKPGAVILSQLAGAPILPLACAVGAGVRLPTWDRLLVPLPFARVAFAVGAPILIERDLPSERIDAESARVGALLDELERSAQAALG